MNYPDYVFTKHATSATISNKELVIIPFGDVHRFAPGCHTELWQDFCRKYKNDKRDLLFLGMGDYDDLASESERKKLAAAQLHESTNSTFDKHKLKATEDFIEEIEFMKGRCLGIIQGNHYWSFPGGTTSDALIAQALDAPWLGWFSVLHLVIRHAKWTNYMVALNIAACHGRAGGKLIGTSINQVADMASVVEGCDLYIFGHDHQKGGWGDVRLVPTIHSRGGFTIKEQTRHYCRSGSFLKAYIENEPTYIVKRLKRAANLGNIEIKVNIVRVSNKNEDTVQKSITVEA